MRSGSLGRGGGGEKDSGVRAVQGIGLTNITLDLLSRGSRRRNPSRPGSPAQLAMPCNPGLMLTRRRGEWGSWGKVFESGRLYQARSAYSRRKQARLGKSCHPGREKKEAVPIKGTGCLV